mmetsp:Transcript_36018/g.41746  ORF Transcript_36018/g.41746 Transcript_36018/m.41746 type:complete len:335 (-) Transcript_36018:403-1407(-)
MKDRPEPGSHDLAAIRHVQERDIADHFGNRAAGWFGTNDEPLLAILDGAASPELHQDVFTRAGGEHRFFVGPDAFHLVLIAGGHEYDLHPGADGPGFYFSHGDGATIGVPPEHGDANVSIRDTFLEFDGIQQTDESADAGVVIPVRVALLPPGTHGRIDFVLHVGTPQPRNGQEFDLLLNNIPAAFEIRAELADAFVEPYFGPHYGRIVHLVNHHHQITHPERLGEHGVLPRLPPAIEPRLELTLPRGYHQHTDIGLTRAHDHVRDVILVPRRVQDRVPLHFRVEMGTSHLHRFTLGAFFFVGVHDERQKPRFAVQILRLLFVFLDRALVDIVG